MGCRIYASTSESYILQFVHVLVVGGTGLVGRYLVRKLLSLDFQVTSIARSRSLDHHRLLTQLQIDLAVPGWPLFLKDMIGEIDVVCHLAYSTTSSPNVNRRVTTESAIDLGRLIKNLDLIHFVYVGSVSVYGLIPNGPFVTESSPFSVYDSYSQNKADATQAVLNLGCNFPVTVLHPSLIWDRQSPRIQRLRHDLKSGYFLLDDTKVGIANMIHADDLASAILLSSSRAYGDVSEEYIINGECVPYPQLFEQIELQLGVRNRTRLPPFTSRLIRWKFRDAAYKFGVRVPIRLSDYKKKQYVAGVKFSSQKAKSHFGFDPSHSVLMEL